MNLLDTKRMSKVVCLVLMFAFLVVSPSFAIDMNADTPVKITGDSVEYFYKEKRAVGQGNIRIEHEGSTLMADEVEVNLSTKEATARGKVTLLQDGAVYEGEYVHVNLETKSADISQVKAAMAPNYWAKGETVHKEKDDYYSIKNGYVTTCDGTDCDSDWVPPYRIQSSEVLYYPDDKVVIRNAVFLIKNVPFFYIPVMVIPIVEIDRFPLEVQAGRKSEWGAYALTRYRYMFDKNSKGNVMFDVRENQGLAGGVEHFYRTEDFGEGAVRYYYADDKCGAEDISCSRSDSHISDESSRYRAQFRHRWKMSPNTAVNAQINKLSDEFILQDFFLHDEYERIAFPDNYVSVVHAQDDFTLSALTRFRLDDFVGVVERSPELRFDTHTQSLHGTPIYYRHEIQASKLNQLNKDEEKLHSEANRVDFLHTFSYVWNSGAWTVTPYVGSRETYYSRNKSGDDRDFFRYNLESGVDISAKYFKTYDANFKGLGMDIAKLRHIVTPNIGYHYQSKPSHVKESLYEFDAVDGLDHENFVRLELENKIKTRSDYEIRKNKSSSRTLLRSIVYADLTTPSMDPRKLERVGVDIELSPWDPFQLEFNTEYDFEADEFPYANADAVYRFHPFKISVGQRYLNGESSQMTAELEWEINKDLRARIYERFEFADAETDEFECMLEIRNLFCWTTRLTYNYNDGGSFYVSFSPSAFPETSFQPNRYYRSPIDDPDDAPEILSKPE